MVRDSSMVRGMSTGLLLSTMLMIFTSLFHGVACLGKDRFHLAMAQAPEGGVEVTFPTEPCGDTALVSWTTPPKDPLRSSFVVKCESLRDRVVELVDGDATEASIGPLVFGEEYVCSVTAKTKFGGGGVVESAPFLALSCSGSPLNVTFNFPTENCGNLARISWEAPDDGIPVDSYEVSCVSPVDNFTQSVSSTTFSVELGPLNVDGTFYNCSVVAQNAAGDGIAGTTRFKTGFCASAPIVVDNGEVLPQSVTVVFNDSTTPGNPQETYAIKCVADGEPCTANGTLSGPIPAVGPGEQNSGIVTGLTPGTTYNCYVQAINPIGIVCSTGFVDATTPTGPVG